MTTAPTSTVTATRSRALPAPNTTRRSTVTITSSRTEFSNQDFAAAITGHPYSCIQSEDSVIISPASGLPGASVTVSGGGFLVGETVKIKYKTGLASPASVLHLQHHGFGLRGLLVHRDDPAPRKCRGTWRATTSSPRASRRSASRRPRSRSPDARDGTAGHRRKGGSQNARGPGNRPDRRLDLGDGLVSPRQLP